MNLLNARKEVERIRLRDPSFGSEIATQTRQRSVTASRSHQMKTGGSIAPRDENAIDNAVFTYSLPDLRLASGCVFPSFGRTAPAATRS